MLEPYVELLAALRESDSERSRVLYTEAKTPERGTHDTQEQERARLAHVLLLHGTADDLELVRFLLEQEVTARQSDSFQGAGDTLTILSMLLLEWGEPDPNDVWTFWNAKRANFDTWAGGYDIEFVFAQLPPDEVLRLVEERGGRDARDALAKYDLDAVTSVVPRWRDQLARVYPRHLDAFSDATWESWATLFGDREAMERYGLKNADTADDRARLYERLERYDDAASAWCEASRDAESPWDIASRLRSAIAAAARVPLALPAEVDQLDRLRSQIPSWNTVGLGRMSTQACHELAAALDGEEGARVWAIAERWFDELDSSALVGLQAALAAAQHWGSEQDVARYRAAVDEEYRRIYGSLPED